VVHLAIAATDLVDAASANVRLDPTASSLKLELHLSSDELLLAEPSHPLTVVLDGSLGAEPYPVKLRLERDAEAPLGLQSTLSVSALKSGSADLQSKSLGEAGAARLVAEIAIGDQVLAHAEHEVTIVDTVDVSLGEPLRPVRPVQGFELHVLATGLAGPARSGWVEVRVGQTHVGTARVENGQATVNVRFQASRQERLPLAVRYVPEQPWYRAGNELDTTIEVLPLPLWAHAPWMFLAAVASYWIIRAWRRPGRQREASARPSGESGRAEAVLVRRARGASAWSGVVLDAHTGETIAGADLAIELPEVEATRVVSQCQSGARGRFELPAVRNTPEVARLVVRAKSHSELRQAVPPLGELQISLVARRRNLLMSLTRWARDMGWAGASEPTPAHVADIATKQERDAARTWATDVEQAAYGPVDPGEETERRLAGATPPLDRPAPHKR
jgi:hypothetical protein